MRSEATAAAEHTVRNNSKKDHLKKDLFKELFYTKLGFLLIQSTLLTNSRPVSQTLLNYTIPD